MTRFPDRADRGRSLRVCQPDGGYRFSLDSVLLASFAAPFCGRTALDLGTGSGILLLLLARGCDRLRRGVGVEIQRDLWEFARRNIAENGLEGRLSALCGDIRGDIAELPRRSFSLVICNPPYRRIGEGRRNPDPGKEIARHEVTCTLADVFAAAGRYLSGRGTLALVCSSGRLPEIVALGAAAGIRPETLRFVHPHAGSPATRVLAAVGRSRATPRILPPLIVHAAEGRYHPDVERILSDLPPACRGTG